MLYYKMVKSNINPEKVDYKENREIDDEDVGFASSLYQYEIYDKTIEIALGKAKYTFANYNITYYPLYLIIGDEPRVKIGIFEIDSNNVINTLDEEGDVDLNKGNILLYNFMNIDFLNNIIKKHEKIEVDKNVDNIEKQKGILNDDDKKLQEEIEEDTDIMTLKIPKQKMSNEKEKTNQMLKDGIFVIDQSKKAPLMLEEETQEVARNIKGEYKETTKTKWIEKFMKNNNYDIIENEGNGDCFFSTLRDAFEQMGKVTSVEKLRALLAKEVTDEVYQQYRILYVNFLGEFQTKEKEMKDLKKISIELKKRNDRTKDKTESKQILDEAKKVVEKFNSVKAEKEDIKEMMEEFKFMEGIDSLDKFIAFVQTPNFWADTWAISTLEKILNIKVIILSEESFYVDDLDSVMKCGQLNDEDLEKQGKFTPDFYIMTSYSGNHYELISYKSKRIMKFLEIPFDIKALIVNKCLEKNAGPYYLIQDFRNLKGKLGLSPDEGASNESDDEHMEFDLYDPEIVFTFHSTSDCKPKAGKGSGEKIADDRMTEFNTLNKDKLCNNWRKKLDDSWITPFTIDGHRWGSVEHYYQASQFKKGFPDFYLQFSLDSESEISKDVALAKAAGGKSGKLKDKILRPKSIIIDSDFNEIGLNTRSVEERKNALKAKFTQNLDLKKVLMETKNAKLVHFQRSAAPKGDEMLMKLRRELRSEESNK